MKEPKSGLEVGVWFNGASVWGYHGDYPVIMQFRRLTPEHFTEPYHVVERCTSCSRGRLPKQPVKRWMILPP